MTVTERVSAEQMTRIESERGHLPEFWGRRLAVSFALLCLSITGIAQAQTLSRPELQKLLASDGSWADRFGVSVAISGDRALIGAREDDDVGRHSGSAYVYELNGSGTWLQVAKLTASDGAARDLFGHSVALSGDRALVGAIFDNDAQAGSQSGSAYVFERNRDGTWVQVAKLTASDAARRDYFGNAISLSGNRALIAASGDDDAGLNSGSVYVFELDDEAMWREAAKLTASDAARGDNFGDSVALLGDRALVGADQYDEEAGSMLSGAAYIYELDETGTWTQVARLVASDASLADRFGSSIALSGDRAMVGASFNSDAGRASGSAYIYESDGTTWGEVAKFLASDAEEGDRFGYSVSLSGDRALVGSFSDSAYVYELDGIMWREVAKLTSSEGDLFRGASAVLSSDWALIGAFQGDGSNTGSAYAFDVPGVGDQDQDGVYNVVDNCQTDWNPLQENFEDDLLGDVCDPDDDNDGIEDSLDAFPLDSTRPGGGGLPPLVIDRLDSNQYGFRFEGINSNKEILERSFDASGSSLLLTLVGYDIDTGTEVRVLVNGTEIGFLSRTPNNGRGSSELTIDQSLLRTTGNTLRFEQSNSGWRWGVLNLLLIEISDTGELPPLVLDTIDSGQYGFRFEGIDSHRQSLERQFEASGSDLVLTLSGYDIDTRQEVRVLVNDTEIGFLSKTPNNGRGPSQLMIGKSLLDSSGNTLRFEQLNPGWRWGVTDIFLSNSGV